MFYFENNKYSNDFMKNIIFNNESTSKKPKYSNCHSHESGEWESI